MVEVFVLLKTHIFTTIVVWNFDIFENIFEIDCNFT